VSQTDQPTPRNRRERRAQRYVSTTDAAAVLGISAQTVRRMVERGDLAGGRLPGSRLVRVDVEALRLGQ
jgi:excisionase family DNA binding protein